jgi:hypothetical protein
MKLQKTNKIYKSTQTKKNQKNKDQIWEIKNWRKTKMKKKTFQFEVIFWKITNKTGIKSKEERSLTFVVIFSWAVCKPRHNH